MIRRMLAPIAWCIARVGINVVTFETIDGRYWVRKRRSLISPLFIVLGNVVLTWRHVPVRVLHRREWLLWEQTMQSAIYGTTCELFDRGLLSEKLNGRPLAEIIRSGALDEEGVIDCVSNALSSLFRLHQIEMKIDGRQCLFSHGDATINNVMFDDNIGSCCWFDFDLRHDFKFAAKSRHADDLRALMCSTLECLPAEIRSIAFVQQLLDAMKRAYPDDQTWRTCYKIVNSRWFMFDLFHQGQMFRMKL